MLSAWYLFYWHCRPYFILQWENVRREPSVEICCNSTPKRTTMEWCIDGIQVYTCLLNSHHIHLLHLWLAFYYNACTLEWRIAPFIWYRSLGRTGATESLRDSGSGKAPLMKNIQRSLTNSWMSLIGWGIEGSRQCFILFYLFIFSSLFLACFLEDALWIFCVLGFASFSMSFLCDYLYLSKKWTEK